MLFVGRVASDIWELGLLAHCATMPHRGDGRLIAAGSSRWMYNLLSTGA